MNPHCRPRLPLRSFLLPRIAVVCLAIASATQGADEITLPLEPAAPRARHAIDSSSRGADGVKFGDVDGDGRPDIAAGWEEGGAVRIYLNPGPARAKETWPTITVGNVPRPEDAVIVDLDGDGRAEVVSATEGKDRTIYVHWAPTGDLKAEWRTEPIACTQKRQSWMFILPLDIDRENGIDLVVGSKANGAALGWLRSPKNPRDLAAWTYHPFRAAFWIMSLKAADINRDGFTDILFSDRRGAGGGVKWLENPGATRTAQSRWQEHHVADGAEQRSALFLDHADVDGDGSPEIVTAYQPSRVGIFSHTPGAAWKTQWLNLTGKVGSAKAVSVGDLNGDGRADLVVSFEGAKGPLTGIVWIEQTARGWRMHDLGGPEGIKYDLVPLLDVDGDGDLDVVTTEERDQLGLVWYENPFNRKPGAVAPAPRGR